MVAISDISGGPYMHFVCWVEGATGKHNKLMEQASEGGSTYMGETPLSKLVSSDAARICDELSGLTDYRKWNTVWDYFAEGEERAEAACLILTCTLRNMASYRFRILDVCNSPAKLILRLVESPADQCCEMRKHVAAFILDTTHDFNKYEDVTSKFKVLFVLELRIAKDTGTLPCNCYSFCLFYRCQLAISTQDLEGFMSYLQRITDLAHNMGIACANARMSLKYGEPVTATECCGLHDTIVAEAGTQRSAQRFEPSTCPVPSVDVLKEPAAAAAMEQCRVDIGAVVVRTLQLTAYQYSVWNTVQQNARCVWFISRQPDVVESRRVFLPCWSHHSKLYVGCGTITKARDNLCSFQLTLPALVVPLPEWMYDRCLHLFTCESDVPGFSQDI